MWFWRKKKKAEEVERYNAVPETHRGYRRKGIYPDKSWRSDIQNWYWKGMDDAAIYARAKEEYNEYKSELRRARAENDREALEEYEESWMDSAFLMAVVLFTFGHLEVVPDILNYNPRPNVKLKYYKGCYWDMIPAPVEIARDTQRSLVWFEENKDKLWFNKEHGRYEMRPEE